SDRAGLYARNVTRYFLFQALSNSLFWLPIWVVYLQARGFSLTEIGIADAWTLIIMTFAEIPTGGIADRFGRRVSLVLGAALITIGTGAFVATIELYPQFFLLL